MPHMSSLQPEHALVIRSFVLPSLKAEHLVTRRVIEAIPGDRSDYRPDPVVKCAIDLAWHIVGAEHRFLDAVAAGAFDFTNTGRPDSVRTPADVVGWYGETFERDVERLKALTGDQLVKTIDFRGILQLPAIAYARSTARVTTAPWPRRLGRERDPAPHRELGGRDQKEMCVARVEADV